MENLDQLRLGPLSLGAWQQTVQFPPDPLSRSLGVWPEPMLCLLDPLNQGAWPDLILCPQDFLSLQGAWPGKTFRPRLNQL